MFETRHEKRVAKMLSMFTVCGVLCLSVIAVQLVRKLTNR